MTRIHIGAQRVLARYLGGAAAVALARHDDDRGRRARWENILAGGGGTPPLEVGAAFFDAEDFFDDPAGVNSIAGRDGWIVASSTFYTSTTISGLTDGVLLGGYYQGAGRSRYGPVCNGLCEYQVDALIGYPSAQGGTAYSENYHKYLFWDDGTNYVGIVSQGSLNRLSLYTACTGVNGGSETGRTTLISALPGGIGLSNTPARRVPLTLSLSPDAKVRIYLGKVPLKINAIYTPVSQFDISAFMTSGQRDGRIGFYSAHPYQYPLAARVAVRSTASIFHDEEAVFHRGVGHSVIGGSTGEFHVEGKFQGSPVEWIYKLWDATEGYEPTTFSTALPGTNAEGWRRFTPTSTSGGRVVADLVGPTGNWIPEYGFIDADGKYVTVCAPSVLIAKMVLYYGQSVSCGRTNAPTVLASPNQLAGVNAQFYWPVPRPNYPENYIITGTDTVGYNGTYASWYTANGVVEATGEPCVVVVLGFGGAGLSFIGEGGTHWPAFLNVMDQIPGVPEIVNIDHGQARVANSTEASYIPSYANDLRTLIVEPMREMWGDALQFIIHIQGNYGGTNPPPGWSGNWAGFNAAVSALRLVQAGMCVEYGGSDPLIHIGGYQAQIDHGDEEPGTPGVQGGYHYSNEPDGNPKLCKRDVWSIAKHLYGLDVHDSSGPRVTSISRSGARVTFHLDMNGAEALETVNYTPSVTSLPNKTGTVWGFFVATDAAPATPLSIIGISAGSDGQSVDVDLSGDPAAVVRGSLWSGAQWNDENAVCGAYPEDGAEPIPIQPTLDVANGRDYFVSAT